MNYSLPFDLNRVHPRRRATQTQQSHSLAMSLAASPPKPRGSAATSPSPYDPCPHPPAPQPPYPERISVAFYSSESNVPFRPPQPPRLPPQRAGLANGPVPIVEALPSPFATTAPVAGKYIGLSPKFEPNFTSGTFGTKPNLTRYTIPSETTTNAFTLCSRCSPPDLTAPVATPIPIPNSYPRAHLATAHHALNCPCAGLCSTTCSCGCACFDSTIGTTAATTTRNTRSSRSSSTVPEFDPDSDSDIGSDSGTGSRVNKLKSSSRPLARGLPSPPSLPLPQRQTQTRTYSQQTSAGSGSGGGGGGGGGGSGRNSHTLAGLALRIATTTTTTSSSSTNTATTKNKGTPRNDDASYASYSSGGSGSRVWKWQQARTGSSPPVSMFDFESDESDGSSQSVNGDEDKDELGWKSDASVSSLEVQV